MLNELQKDLLKEYVNVFIGKAAGMLSEMANQRVLLTVPEVEVINTTYNIDRQSGLFKHGHIVSSSMQFGDDFNGKALLIFSADKAKILVDSCLGIEPSTGQNQDMALMDTDFDALKEISNVILNSVVGEFSNLVETTVEFTIPDIELVFVGETEQVEVLKKNVYMLLMHTSFTLEKTAIDGVIIIALGVNSLKRLIDRLDAVIGACDEDFYL